MWHKRVLTILFSALFVLGLFHNTYADEIEQKFKDVCVALAKESSRTISPTGKDNAVSDKEIEETFTRQRKLFKEWQEELRGLIKTSPQSIWADDAQYIISALSIEDPKQNAIELELVLSNYPDIKIEDWTKENLLLLLPSKLDEQIVRLELCSLYKQLGETEKLNNLAEESIKKFPEKTELFQEMLNRKSIRSI